MRKTVQAIFLILIFLSVVILGLRFGSKPLSEALGLKERAGIRIESTPMATVYVSGQEVGKTPYETDNLTVGNHLIEIKTTDSRAWKGYVPLNSGTVTVVNRELSPTDSTSSGEIISLDKGTGVMVMSTPNEALVNIDGKDYGKTPVVITDLGSGEHTFILSRNSYLKRSIRSTLISGYRLNLNVDLALSEADLTTLPQTPVQSEQQQVVVKDTPTSFLRVRETPSTNGKEIGRVTPGTTLTLLEEIPSWYKIRTNDGKEGYISSTYAEKKK